MGAMYKVRLVCHSESGGFSILSFFVLVVQTFQEEDKQTIKTKILKAQLVGVRVSVRRAGPIKESAVAKCRSFGGGREWEK
jgi:hypothetical protein